MTDFPYFKKPLDDNHYKRVFGEKKAYAIEKFVRNLSVYLAPTERKSAKQWPSYKNFLEEIKIKLDPLETASVEFPAGIDAEKFNQSYKAELSSAQFSADETQEIEHTLADNKFQQIIFASLLSVQDPILAELSKIIQSSIESVPKKSS